jgi:hypothetical protein
VLKRVAWLLAFAAVASLVGASLFALSRRPTTLSAGGVSVKVPHGWQVVTAGQGIVYGPVQLDHPAVFGADWCDHHSRAFFGLVTGSLDRVAQDWAKAIGATARVMDGRADAEIAALPGSCQPPRVHLTVIDTGARQLVLVRDVGLKGDLSEAAAEKIAESVRSS